MNGRLAAWRLVVAAVCCGSFGCVSDDVTLQGSGATFPAPLYKRWFLDYYGEHPNVRVNYTPIGSGAGIRQFTSGLVTFGASDAGISKGEEEKLPEEFGGVYPLPMTAGAIVLSYNVPGLTEPIRLSREAYVRIFLRDVTNWNDEAVAKTNPGVRLPDLAITLVARADSSGTSYAFSNHMGAVAKALGLDWKPGVSKSPDWSKDAIKAQGNDGVAALIQLTPGAVGYLEFGYADLGGLPMAALQNKRGQFVPADKEGVAGRKALEGAKIPDDLQIKVPDTDNEGAYPIVTYTWVLCRKRYKNPVEADTLKAVLLYCLEDDRQKTAEQLGYLRLPPDVIAKVRDAVQKIEVVR